MPSNSSMCFVSEFAEGKDRKAEIDPTWSDFLK